MAIGGGRQEAERGSAQDPLETSQRRREASRPRQPGTAQLLKPDPRSAKKERRKKPGKKARTKHQITLDRFRPLDLESQGKLNDIFGKPRTQQVLRHKEIVYFCSRVQALKAARKEIWRIGRKKARSVVCISLWAKRQSCNSSKGAGRQAGGGPREGIALPPPEPEPPPKGRKETVFTPGSSPAAAKRKADEGGAAAAEVPRAAVSGGLSRRLKRARSRMRPLETLPEPAVDPAEGPSGQEDELGLPATEEGSEGGGAEPLGAAPLPRAARAKDAPLRTQDEIRRLATGGSKSERSCGPGCRRYETWAKPHSAPSMREGERRQGLLLAQRRSLTLVWGQVRAAVDRERTLEQERGMAWEEVRRLGLELRGPADKASVAPSLAPLAQPPASGTREQRARRARTRVTTAPPPDSLPVQLARKQILQQLLGDDLVLAPFRAPLISGGAPLPAPLPAATEEKAEIAQATREPRWQANKIANPDITAIPSGKPGQDPREDTEEGEEQEEEEGSKEISDKVEEGANEEQGSEEEEESEEREEESEEEEGSERPRRRVKDRSSRRVAQGAGEESSKLEQGARRPRRQEAKRPEGHPTEGTKGGKPSHPLRPHSATRVMEERRRRGGV
ncbi:hypothetical protein ACSSS7_004364 [Eimeria intestinalis]